MTVPGNPRHMSYPLSRLSHLYREPGPWTFVQLDVGLDPHGPGQALRLRWDGIKNILLEKDVPPEQFAALDRLFEGASEQAAGACRFVLAGPAGIAVDETLDAGTSCVNRAAVDRIPMLSPLIRRHAHDLPYLVVETGRDGARISAFRADGRPVSAVDVEGETVHLTKVHGGGWAHRRFQQTTEEVWRRNAQEVGEAVERYWNQAGSRMVVITGDVRAREQLRSQLPSALRENVIELDVQTRPPGTEEKVLADAIAAHRDELAEQERNRLTERFGAGRPRGLAVDGIGATVHALRQAQVEYLVLDLEALEGRTLLALRDEPWVASGPEGVTGTSVLTEAPAVDVLIRAGALTDARLLPAGPEAGEVRSDGVSALLRWPTGPQ